jgi:hypothetical protein
MADHITPTTLKQERGWTDGLIKRFLGEPDTYAPNPHYRSGPSMRLYDLERVTAAEESADFKAAFSAMAERRAKLSRAVQQSVDKKRDDLLATVERLEIRVAKHPVDSVRNAAIRHYNALWSSRGKHEKHASHSDSPEFLERITHNFIRHELVTVRLANGDEMYRDAVVGSLKGRIGKGDAYLALWHKVADAIDEAYPDLADTTAGPLSD